MSLITLTDLARRAGVSKSTVSLALRDSAKLPLTTRERVKALAREMGYRPDPLVRQLSSQIRQSSAPDYQATLAWLNPWPERDYWRQDPNWLTFFNSASERGAELGYHVEEFWLREPGLTARRATQILQARGIRGLLVAPGKPRIHLGLDWNRFATVCVGFSMHKPRFHHVSNTHYYSMSLALHHLKKLGYQRIGYTSYANTDRYIHGLYKAGLLLFQSGIPQENRISHLEFSSPPFDRRLFEQWLEQEKPDAIIVDRSLPVSDWLKELGLRCPRDIGLVKIMLMPDETGSGIDNEPKNCGISSVELLVEELHHNALGVPRFPKSVLLDGVWREGDSTRPIRKARSRVVRSKVRRR